MDIKEIIKKNNLNENEVSILEEILRQIKLKNYRISVREVAKATFVSTTSVVRLAKKLGYLGYSDMIISMKNESINVVEFRFRDVLSSVLINQNSIVLIDELIHDILSGEYYRIHFIGIGYSAMPASYIREKLEEMDYITTTKSPLDFSNEKPFIVVFVTENGETTDLSFIAERCVDKDCRMYVISSQEKSTICRLVPNHIIIKRERNSSSTASYPNYFIGNTLILLESIIAILYNMKNAGEYIEIREESNII